MRLQSLYRTRRNITAALLCITLPAQMRALATAYCARRCSTNQCHCGNAPSKRFFSKLPSVSRFTSTRQGFTSLNVQRRRPPPDRSEFLSINDALSRAPAARPYPPSMEMEDEGFGALDYDASLEDDIELGYAKPTSAASYPVEASKRAERREFPNRVASFKAPTTFPNANTPVPSPNAFPGVSYEFEPRQKEPTKPRAPRPFPGLETPYQYDYDANNAASKPTKAPDEPQKQRPINNPTTPNIPPKVETSAKIVEENYESFAAPKTAVSPAATSQIDVETTSSPAAVSSHQPPSNPAAFSSQTFSQAMLPREAHMLSSDFVRDGSKEAPAALDDFLSKSSDGTGVTSLLDQLQAELQKLTDAIYTENNGEKFNISSPKQVAFVLFGEMGGSTRKEVLEGMAGTGNRMASLIVEYRACKHRLNKLDKKKISEEKGTAVRSATTVSRLQRDPHAEASSEKMMQVNQMADPLLLLDASAYIHRAYHSMPAIHRSDGMPTGAVMGFCKMLNSMLLGPMLEGQQPRLVLCFDAKGKTFRHDLYDEYKGNRAATPMDLIPQFDLVREAAAAYGICQIEAPSFEADDVIATLATMAIDRGVDANILSADKDLMQLVTDLDATPSIQMIDPMKKDRTTYLQVKEKWGVPPNRLGDVLALAGDASDNIPGVRGIGPKTAAKLITEFGDLNNLLENIDKIPQNGVRTKLAENEANARLSRILVDLKRNVPMEAITGFPAGVTNVADLRMEAMDADRILAYYDEMGFKSLKYNLEQKLKGVKPVKRKSTYKQRPKASIPRPEDYADVPF